MNLRVVKKAIVHYTNKERRRHNLRSLRASKRLVKAARAHAHWCAGRNQMTHTGSKGSQPWDRARDFGYSSNGVSENMWQQHGRNNTAWKSKFRWRSDLQFGKAAVISWMNSPGHRANLLNPHYTDIGVGLSRRNRHTILVQMFGDLPVPIKSPQNQGPKNQKSIGGPYTHYHNWSFHTHHKRPKNGNHYRAIRRRQRPWRIAFTTTLIVILLVLGLLALNSF